MTSKDARRAFATVLITFAVLLAAGWSSEALAVGQQAPISGEIQQITLANPADVWSRGTIVVGGQTVIIPSNLLIDLPANRLTLQQIFDQAPAACKTLGESGLAKGDGCNTTGVGGFATISANMTNKGNVIAGDVFIEKGREAVTGKVTYIDYNSGYFRVNGKVGSASSGVMIRPNDPGSRHTIQQGLGCADGSPNCSPDPRFTLDPDNYTNCFISGMPFCIPSSKPRTFVDSLDFNNNGNTTETLTAQSDGSGVGDTLCPSTNRTVNGGRPVDDSRRFAPIMIGDNVTAEGNFEIVNGVQFLSCHTLQIAQGLFTQNSPTQPDYMFIAEAGMDAPGYQNQRVRTLIIGFTTKAPADVVVWTIHRDPVTNAAHEFPLATTNGCEAAGGAGTCTSQGLAANGTDIFRIRHDVDFITNPPANAKLSPCAHLRADTARFGASYCPGGGTLVEEFGILSPIPHEIQARTGHKLLFGNGLQTRDINFAVATNGQYLFPFGINLGGIDIPEFVEVNLDGVSTPYIFSGIPWNLDRRLSPGGCIGGVCEPTAKPLDPFPYGGLDPRTQANTPLNSYSDPNYTASPLTIGANRVLSYVDAVSGKFNGNATLLAWPPKDPPARAIPGVGQVVMGCSVGMNSVDSLTITQAQYSTGTRTWTVSGTSSAPGQGGNNVAVHIGSSTTGPTVGTARCGRQGSWRMSVKSPLSPDPLNPRISIDSSQGGQVTDFSISIVP